MFPKGGGSFTGEKWRVRTMRKILLSIILVLLFCTQSLAESSVWKIQKGDSVIYLGGTCHLLRHSDFPLPAEFDKAYRESDSVVFETDLGEFNNLSAQQKLMSKTMYNDGSTVDKHLSSQTYKLLSDYCDANGIPLEALKKFKPPMIVVTIEAVELAKLNVMQEGVDTYFYKLAKRDKKIVEGLETIDEQIDFLAGMGEGNEDAFVRYTIEDFKSIQQQYESLVGAWKKGDTRRLYDLMVADLKEMPKLYKTLLTDRNKKWLPMIESYQKTGQKKFILVGVGHLVGPDGILEVLRQKGYKVEKL
jgi:uncharacterized protein YbaP (TraB family)